MLCCHAVKSCHPVLCCHPQVLPPAAVQDACSKCVSRLRSVLKDQRCVYCQVRSCLHAMTWPCFSCHARLSLRGWRALSCCPAPPGGMLWCAALHAKQAKPSMFLLLLMLPSDSPCAVARLLQVPSHSVFVTRFMGSRSRWC